MKPTVLAPRSGLLLATAMLLAGCDGPQSALAPAGDGAERIANLFWWMLGGSTVIWTLVLGLAAYVTRFSRGKHSLVASRWLILGGGVVFPTVVLSALLIYGLMLIPALRTPEDVGMRIEVSGEQWWWRVHYPSPDGGGPIELANEVRLPLGERVAFDLLSPDVIHSFWVPSLAGKVDMIPGRTTELIVQPTQLGTFRGACAEYCGTAHALMNFQVVVMEPAAFERWLAHQAEPAQPPRSEIAQRGLESFLANGCGACHAIRGTEADGRLGPDLTHVGSRLGLGADVLPNTTEAFVRWIGHTDRIKPDVRMPAYGMLPDDELAALATYLSELE